MCSLQNVVRATLEVESYLPKPAVVGSVVNPDVDEFTVGAISLSNEAMGRMPQSSEQTLMQAIDQLTLRIVTA